MRCSHQFALLLTKGDGRLVGEAVVEPDWEPAREWTLWDAIRRGQLPPGAGAGEAHVEPLWHAEVGAPFARGFRLELAVDGHEVSADFPVQYFRALAASASSQLVAAGKLAQGDTFLYVLTASPRDEPAPEAFLLKAVEVTSPLPIRESSLPAFVRDASAVVAETSGDVPVFIAHDVLEETRALAHEAKDRETGGVLLGHLYRDTGTGCVFAHITAQVPAPHTVADATSLTFTSGTWSALRAATVQRGRGELMAGWWHSHVVEKLLKEGSTLEQRSQSPLAADFFSVHDRLLHRTVFSRSYGLALIVNVLGEGVESFSMFGWRQALLEPRGFARMAPEKASAA